MGQPKAITYEQVVSDVGKESARDVWKKIGSITGAGDMGTSFLDGAVIDLTDATPSISEQVSRLIADAKKPTAKDAENKTGGKQ